MKSMIRILVTLVAATSIQLSQAEEVYVYSSRNEHLIKPLFDLYEKKTGVKVKYVTDKEAPLVARLKSEGKSTPADLFITVDAGNLWYAAEEGVLQPITSESLTTSVPAHLRDPEGRWFGLSIRARTIVYSTERVKASDLSSYEDLASDKWKGRLCLRSSQKVYNQSLVATMIARLGEKQTESVVKGWVNNLAAKPFSNDTKVMQAIAAGQCDVGLVNTYYFGRLLKSEPKLKLALFWPNQKDSGVHVNISGAGVTKYAKHPQAAQKLLEWLAGPEAQQEFAGLNMEYPVNSHVPVDKSVQAWGTFKQDPINVNEAGKLQAKAVQLMDRVGYR